MLVINSKPLYTYSINSFTSSAMGDTMPPLLNHNVILIPPVMHDLNDIMMTVLSLGLQEIIPKDAKKASYLSKLKCSRTYSKPDKRQQVKCEICK